MARVLSFTFRRLTSLTAVVMMFMGRAEATVHRVPLDFATISAAVAAASTGDTIRVFAGSYVEHVNVSKSLVLIGSGPDTTTTIEAPADFATNSAYDYALANFVTERTIVHIGGSAVISVTMKGFTIDGKRLGPSNSESVSYSALLAERCSLTLTENRIKNVLPADSSQTYHTSFNGRGIHVRGDSAVATISLNHLEHINRFHILINATDITTALPAVFPQAVVSNDTIVGKGIYNGAQKGIWFNNGATGTISGNVISNLDYPDPFIESDRGTGITVRRGRLNGSSRNVIVSNTVTTSTFVNNKGIFVENKKDSVSDNTITGFRYGLQIDDPDTVSALRNTITGGQVGIMISTTTVGGSSGVPSLVGPYKVVVGGSPADKNTITGQTTSAEGGFAIALSFRDLTADGTFMSSVPVDARFNDFGVYTEAEIKDRIWDRADTTTILGDVVDTVLYYPFYTPKVTAAVKVFLQGAYNTAVGADSMFKLLNTGGTLATHFGATAVPAGAVDSINIEFRNAETAAGSSTRKFVPAWLLTNGTVKSFSDTTKDYVEFDTTLAGLYYFVIRHRNHLALMCTTAQALEGGSSPSIYDFTTAQNKAFGSNPMNAIGTKFGMVSGDGNANGGVNAIDRNLVWRPQNGTFGYLSGDFNLSGNVNAIDRNLHWRVNNGKFSQVP